MSEYHWIGEYSCRVENDIVVGAVRNLRHYRIYKYNRKLNCWVLAHAKLGTVLNGLKAGNYRFMLM